MQRSTWLYIVLCACCLALAPGFAAAQQAGGAAPTPEEQAMMAAAMPGEHHQHLNHMAGSWNTKLKFWMAPGTAPMESTGTAEAKWILGGRYLESVHMGNVMGMPFEGHGTEGYDNLAKQYVGTWVDNMGTGVMVSEGTCSEGGKVHTSQSEMIDPMSGKMVKIRSVVKAVDANTFRMDMYMTPAGGAEYQTMELVATRK